MKATLRRILKYMPALVLGLTVLAWLASSIRLIEATTALKRSHLTVQLINGTFVVHTAATDVGMYWWNLDESSIWDARPRQGSFWYSNRYGFVNLGLPIPWLLTLLLPLAIGPFLSFRFRLWHYLAFTALVAVELAYYLRWQG